MITISELPNELRSTGIEIIGDASWGLHFCNFYDSKQDLLDILVPYFKTGLENNEYCLWITSDPITQKEAADSLRIAMPDIDDYVLKHSIEILPHTDWFLKDGSFHSEGVINEWEKKLNRALESGYIGMRVNANAFWPDRELWKTFIDYERDFNEQIKNKRIIALSTYPLALCDASDLLDVAKLYDIAVTMRGGYWEILESPVLRQSKAQFKKNNEVLERAIVERTRQLEYSNNELKNEIKDHINTENALQKSEANLSSIFKNTKTALVLLDTKLNILLFNGIANDLAKVVLGREYEVGLCILEYISSDQKEKMENDCIAALKGTEVLYQTDFKMSGGSIRWFDGRIFPVINDDEITIGVCITAEEITERKKAEIDKEIMTNDLIQRNKDLEQFSYMVSHNLRAPVANIMGFSKMLKNPEHTDDNKSIFIEQLNTSAGILDEVIRDLNLILKIKTAQNLKQEKISFSSIINNLKKSIKYQIEKENAVIITNFDEADEITGNRVYLYSIFLNLITNSIKYHQPGIPPLVEINTSRVNDKLVIEFKDNGLGIDLNKNSDKVFGLYKRFHADIEGKGMGLFMVKTQVDILGGRINIDSKVNKGTIFTIELNQ